MKASVADAFVRVNTPWEGVVHFPYLDRLGLVTTGMGNLIDPVGMSLGLPWCHRDTGEPATPDEIRTAWYAVKDRQDLSQHGGMAFKNVTDLALSDEAVTALVLSKLRENEAHLRTRVPYWDRIPADGQMSLLSWCWAVGAFAHFPKMLAAVNRGDFVAASKECAINPKVGTIVLRSEANATMLRNAAYVACESMDPEVLYYPRDLDPLT